MTPVNDAPIASGAASVAPTPENTANPPGDTVAHLFGGTLSDAADNQRSPANPGGSLPNSIAGVAITGNGADPSQGSWRYSLDNGATWIPLPAGLSDSNALVLSGSVRLDFLPAPNFSGTPGGLVARVIETSSDMPVFGTTTGAGLAAAALARPGVDVSGAHAGGRTSVSLVSVALDTRVAATDVSPLAGAPAVLLPVVTGDPASGDGVAHLFGPSFSSPHGDPLTGVVIVGDGATPDQGIWRYSLDGGATFIAVSIDVSLRNGLLLPAGAVLSFLPAPGFTGMPGGLTTYLVGGTSTFVAPGLRGSDVAGLTSARSVDLSGLISNPTGPITTNTVDLSTTILPRVILPAVVPAVVPAGVPQLTSNPDTDRDRDAITTEPFGRLFAVKPLLEDRTSIPHNWLTATEIHRFVIVEQLAMIDVPTNMFYDSGPRQRLDYVAQLPGGLPLPPWLSFDPRTLTLFGTPPRSAYGILDVQVTARDEAGNRTTGEVHIRIGRQPLDLLALLRVAERKPIRVPAALTRSPGSADRPTHPLAHRPVRGHPARPGDGAPHAERPPSDPGRTPQPAAARPGRAGFSAQLRGFGGADRALAFLDAITPPSAAP